MVLHSDQSRCLGFILYPQLQLGSNYIVKESIVGIDACRVMGVWSKMCRNIWCIALVPNIFNSKGKALCLSGFQGQNPSHAF